MRKLLFGLVFIQQSLMIVATVQKNEPCLATVPRKTQKNFINYGDFKSVCDVLFLHENREGQAFDPIWFRVKGKANETGQRRIVASAPFDPSAVQPGDLVFVRRPQSFFESIHPQIHNPYIIITHGNSSSKFKRKYISVLEDSKIIAWFTIHAGNAVHPKLHPLPLGVRQLPNFSSAGKRLSLKRLCKRLKKTMAKKYLVYMNFLDRTHPERKKIRELFENKPFCLEENKVDFETFMSHMAQSKFTLAPRGVGPADSFRIWESLMVGSIPIVKRSRFMDCSLYEGLPVLIIDKWEDVTEEFLEKKYAQMSSLTYSTHKLYMQYWLKKIFTIRDQFLSKEKIVTQSFIEKILLVKDKIFGNG
ncbi:hypothetical protein H0X06_05185 [Candidatus Dependentiae bacterium]|nr:hypothetical protein [Candidatus Dependentiae bacterium]